MSPNSEQSNTGTSISDENELAPRTNHAVARAPNQSADTQNMNPGELIIRTSIEQLNQMLRTPAAGAALSGTLVLGAAAVFGVVEASVAAGAAYIAYRLLRKKQSNANAPSA